MYFILNVTLCVHGKMYRKHFWGVGESSKWKYSVSCGFFLGYLKKCSICSWTTWYRIVDLMDDQIMDIKTQKMLVRNDSSAVLYAHNMWYSFVTWYVVFLADDLIIDKMLCVYGKRLAFTLCRYLSNISKYIQLSSNVQKWKTSGYTYSVHML